MDKGSHRICTNFSDLSLAMALSVSQPRMHYIMKINLASSGPENRLGTANAAVDTSWGMIWKSNKINNPYTNRKQIFTTSLPLHFHF